MLNLQSVTLCGVDTRSPFLALLALQHSMAGVQYGDAILFAYPVAGLHERAMQAGVRLQPIEHIDWIEKYSDFILRRLAGYINTNHALVTQWDGFVLDPSAWRGEFLDYDYVGALWTDVSGAQAVGNGGFSLRSKRLLAAMQDPAMEISHPEDLCICRVNRLRLEHEHGIRFAPPSLAAAFAYEHVMPTGPVFGFHGVFNLIDALTPEQMLVLTKEMSVPMAFSAGTRSLARALVYGGQYQAATQLLDKRIRGGDRRWRTLSLWLRMKMRKWLGFGRSALAAHRRNS